MPGTLPEWPEQCIMLCYVDDMGCQSMVMTSCTLSVNSIQSMVALCIHHAVDQGVLVCLMMICDWSAQNTQSTQIQQVTLFHITNWSPDGVCTNLATITDVIEEVGKVQKRTGNQPIVVHCRYLLPLCLGSCEIT